MLRFYGKDRHLQFWKCGCINCWSGKIEALQKEHETTLKNIARYEDILNHYDSMATLIMEELDAFKKSMEESAVLRLKMQRRQCLKKRK